MIIIIRRRRITHAACRRHFGKFQSYSSLLWEKENNEKKKNIHICIYVYIYI